MAGVAANAPAKNGEVAANFHLLLDADVATKNRRVATDLPLILNYNVSAEGGYVPGNASADLDAATKAGCPIHLFVGSDPDVVSHLGAITIGKRSGRKQHQQPQGERKQSDAMSIASHKTSTVHSNANYGTDEKSRWPISRIPH